MTNIQIRYLEYLESKRKNLRNEQLTAEQLKIERDKLAETIANNLRNYKVNVSKNQIQALYNEQLDDRERDKLAETIRSNMVAENTRLFEALEKQRASLKSEELKEREQVIKTNEMLINALTSGKASDLPTALFNWLRGAVSADIVTGGSISNSTWNYLDGVVGGKLSTTNIKTKSDPKAEKYDPETNSFSNAKGKADKYDPITGTWTYVKGSTNEAANRKKEENEIPTDFSNSFGPSSQRTINVTVPNKTPTNVIPSTSPASQIKPAASTGSAIIYAPGAKTGPGW